MRLTSLVSSRLGLFAIIFCGLVVLYVSVYVSHSANGHYQIMMSDIGRIEAFGWVPSGVSFAGPETEKQKRWDLCMFYLYYPLWRADYAYFHPWKDAYITSGQVHEWKDQHQFQDFASLSRQLPATVPVYTITNVLGNPNRTNSLANGLTRWEYDYRSTNGPTYGSLFFNRRSIFEGSSTNVNAKSADFN